MKFATQARVNVPGTKAQGVIVDVTETVTGFPVYALRWLDEAGETHTGSVGEGDLVIANPPVVTLKLDPSQSIPSMVADFERCVRGASRLTVKQLAGRALKKVPAKKSAKPKRKR